MALNEIHNEATTLRSFHRAVHKMEGRWDWAVYAIGDVGTQQT